MSMDVVDYEIFGDDIQFVEIELDPGEAAIGEAGSMMMMQDGIQMDTVFGDGSSQASQSGLLGKLLGAGGGGFFLFYVTPFRKHELIARLETLGLQVRPFRFEQEGLSAWTAREARNQPQTDTP